MNELTPVDSAFLRLTHKDRGFSLIELMVSIAIGFLVVGSAIAIFASNRQTYVATENVGRVQENMRIAFELVARDVREAAGTPCSPHISTLRNVIPSSTANWWTDSTAPLRIVGYTGSQAFPAGSFGVAVGSRIAGTQGIQLLSTSNSRVEVASHNEGASQFVVNTTGHGFAIGDYVLACDYERSALFPISSASDTSTTVGYNSGGSSLRPDDGDFGPGSVLAKWRAVRWFIGVSTAASGRSLYQSSIQVPGGVPIVQEVAPDVQNIDMQYLVNGVYLPANGVTDWNLASAVRIDFVVQGPDRVGTGGNRLQRNITHIIALRMRNK